MPFIYPTVTELRTIEPTLVVRGRAGRLGLDLMPSRPVNAAKVRWTQQDNYAGLQQLRGMDGQPTHVKRVGQKTYEYEPGVFGEFVDLTETELTTRAGSVDVATVPIDVNDLVVNAQNYLIGRELDRQESSIWTVMSTGVLEITIAGPNGTQIGYRDSYAIQEFTADVPWSTGATATPLADFVTISLIGPGTGVRFDGVATAYMNSITASWMLDNRNNSDIGGRLVSGGSTVNSIADISTYFVGRNVPRIQVYDEGYIPGYDSAGTALPFQKFIADGDIVIVGRRPSGANIGEYQITRNASAGFRPESYQYVIDRANGAFGNAPAEKRTPANIEIHRGHNGGPCMQWPSAILVAHVGP